MSMLSHSAHDLPGASHICNSKFKPTDGDAGHEWRIWIGSAVSPHSVFRQTRAVESSLELSEPALNTPEKTCSSPDLIERKLIRKT
jgi:hypothetical protein